MLTSIGFIGLGAMGSRMAAHLLGDDDGLRLKVWNRSAGPADSLVARGATRAATPRDAASDCEVVISMLTDDEACREVWLHGPDAACQGLAAGALVLEASTVTADWIAELAGQVRQRRARLLDTPVVGSRPQADAGSVIFLAGGAVEDVGTLRPLLLRMGSAVHHTGPVGTASVVKLIVNTLFAVQVAAFGEMLEAGRRAGLPPEALQPLLAQLPVTSPAAAAASALMAEDRFEPLFPVELVRKDMGYANALTRPGDAPWSLARTALESYSRAAAAGLGGENITAVAKLYRDGDR